jgi:predicted PurR-regulated permease PerM
MEINDKLVKEISAIVVIILFGVLVFFAIQPLIYAILWGLILGYVFMPVYNKILHYVKNDYLAASITLILSVLIILIPMWFIVPLVIQQIFEIYKFSQAMDLQGFVNSIFPGASTQFVAQFGATLNTMIGKLASVVMSSLVDMSLNVPLILVDVFVAGFVFFFTLKDADKIKAFVKSISPLSKAKEKIVIKQFKDITYSTVYGRFLVGKVQGLLAGLGFLIFGVKNALVFTMLSVFLAVLPVLGVFLVWIPVAIYMFAAGNVAMAIAFVLYNLVLVSNVDNLLMAYIVSKRTSLSPVFALISCIGGLFLFGVTGLVLGPLIFAYFIILVDLYRNRNLLELFADESGEAKKSESK